MKFSRRDALRAGQLCAAAAVLPRTGFAAPPVGPADPLLGMNAATFVPHLRSTFTANRLTMTPTWLTLTDVRGFASPESEGFVLEFYAVGQPLSQNTYALEHSALGKFDLFLVPSGTNGYTAVINRLKSGVPSYDSVPHRSVRDARTTAENRRRTQAQTQDA